MDDDRTDWLVSLGVAFLSLAAYLYLILLACLFSL